MPGASANLFDLSASTPRGGLVHGGALAHGSAEATASLRRGLDLSAEIEVEGRLSGELGHIVVGTLDAQAQAGAGIALSAALPLDLFDEAGLVARFRAQAAASASVAATIGLDTGEFRSLVRERFEPPLEGLLEIVLDEVRVGAGVWGRAAFSAEIYAQAVLAGTLLESAEGGPGFSFSAEYGEGWGAGAGAEFVANFGFEDPRRLLRRLSEATGAAALQQAEAYLRTRPQAEAAAAGPALAVLRILLPLATGAAVDLGFELADASGPEARDRATHAVVGSFVGRAQQVLLEGVVEMALGQLAELLEDAGLPDPRTALSADRREELVELLAGAREAVLTGLASTGSADPERWLLAVLAVLEPLDGLLTLGYLPTTVERDARQAVSLLWAGGVLAHRVVSVASDPDAASVFGAALAPVPNGSPTAAHVAEALGKAPGSALTAADLVAFLVGADPLTALRTEVPWAAGVIDWLEEASGSAGGQLVQRLLVDLDDPDDDAAEALLAFLGASLGDAVADEVVPRLLDPLKARDPGNEALRLFVDELVVPTLVALPVVVLPNLPGLDAEEGRLRMREGLSAILLQSLGRFLLGATDVLLHHGLEHSEQALRDVGDSIRAAGEESPTFALLASAAAGAVIPVAPTPGDIDRILQLSADVVGLIDAHEREPLIDAARVALTMGLGTEATREATLDALSTTDAAPRQEDLEAVLRRAEDGAWRIMAHVAPELLDLVAGHFLEQAELLARAVEEGAREIVAAVEAAVEWLTQELDRLAEELDRLLRSAGELLTRMLADVRALTSHLRGLEEQVVADVRSRALGLIEQPMEDLDLPEWARDSFRTLLGSLFDGVDWLLDLPLTLLESVAGWVEEILTSAQAAASNDEHQLRQAVRQRILATSVLDVEFSLALVVGGYEIFDLGTITLSGGTVLGTVADAILADAIFSETVRASAVANVQRKAFEAQAETVRGEIDGTRERPEAQAAAAALAPGDPLAARFTSPGAGALVEGEAHVVLHVDGANRTFTEQTLGVPRRVRVRVNGREYAFAPEHWTESATGVSLSFGVSAPGPSPARPPRRPSRPVPAITLSRATGVRARLDDEDNLVFTRSPSSTTSTRPASVASAASAMPHPRAAARARAHAVATGDARLVDEPVSVRATGGANLVARPERRGDVMRATGLGGTLLQPEPSAEPAPLDSGGQPLLPGHLGLNVVQVATSDGKGHETSGSLIFHLGTEEPAPGPRPVTPPARAFVDEVDFAPPGPDWQRERVTIRSGSTDGIDLEGWTLRDLAGHVYRFPAVVLPPGATVNVWTGPGTTDEENLHWGRRAAVWNNRGDAVILADRDGREVHRRVCAHGPGPR